MIGTLVGGKYQVVRRIGAGGMGAVFEAEHQGTKRRVALKVLTKNLLTDSDSLSEISETVRSNVEEVVARFEQEARTAARIDSEHVVQILDAGTDHATGRPYMVMELLRGQNLRQALKRVGILRPDSALRIVAQACRGLAAAHQAGVVHRDIKLANLLLAERGEDRLVVKLLDFGIARVRMDQFHQSHQGPLTRTGSLLGSPQYMSPEQSRGMKGIDHRADIWSLGVVLYRCLCGRTPFDAPTLGELILSVCTKPPPPIQERAPWVRAETAAIVHHALQREPDERFASADEMLDAILALLPDGGELHQSMICAPSEQEQGVVATRAEPPDMGTLATVGPTVALPPDPTPVPASEGTLPSETQLEVDAATEGTRRRTSWLLLAAIVAVLVALGGLTAERLGPEESGPRGESQAAAPAESSALPTVAPPEVSSSPSATAQERSVMLTVEPANAAVEVDGQPAAVVHGRVTIVGAAGSVHEVSLAHGQRQRTVEVVITEQGARPSEITLEPTKAPRQSTAEPSRLPSTKAPQGASPPSKPPPAPEPARTGRVGAVDSFE